MTDQEIEKLREKLGDEFEVTGGYNCAVITVKDIWKGVEFADFKGSVFKIDKFDGLTFYENGWAISKYDCKPTTEAAYVEQLKSKAKELYGEIKNGDRFQFTWIGDGVEQSIYLKGKYDFYYDKESDTLDLHGFPLYNQGKWAKRIERVRVVPSEIHYPKPDNLDQYVTVELRVIGGLLDAKKSKGAVDELAKCLEDYLNKIP